MTRTTLIRIILIALATSAWALSLTRAYRLLDYALSVDNGSINTGNDTSFGLSLVASYSFSLSAALAISWFLPSTRVWLLCLPLAASLLVASEVIRLAPESVIVIFPTMHPFRPAQFSLLIAAAGAAIVWLHRRHESVTHNAG